MLKINHDYANARIRAMKSRLLAKSFFEKLVAMRNVAEVLVALDKTPYRQEIHEEILKAGGVEGIESGLRSAVNQALRKIMKIVTPQAARLLGVVLERRDVQNLKAILRGKHIGAAEDEIISSLAPSGLIQEAALREMVKQPDIRGVIDLAANWGVAYAQPLTMVFADYQANLQPAVFETAIDRFYYREALNKLRRRDLDTRLIREVIAREIDLTNIMTLLRLTREEADMEVKTSHLIAGGRHLDGERLTKLAAFEDVDDLINELGKTKYGKVLTAGWQAFLKSGNFSVIERRLENQIIKENVDLFKADPLSIALAIAYIYAKLNEAINLRIIIRGKEVEMPAKVIKEALVLV